ncbi:NADH-quinone oxidoreductase subunit M [Romeria aff. gracilis LEGE 07310]|uniref:NADH-quinone oxidoreductase subunit M n=1 Tax=Vasconcelosia minhoensis LEGE 07310 TaxID=915328 RepID=A0A8J7DE36_9CYAN|nr:NADH-quinone oxidoreductase subunit M [Romeria aff. gracilis LEGE 07310]
MLSPLIWLPVIGALFIGLVPLSAKQARGAALAVASAVSLWALWLFTQFDLSNFGLQMSEKLPWLPALGLDYELGLDGLALLMVGLNSLLTWIALYSSSSDTERPKLFYCLMLIVSSAIAGAFLAQNFLLFFLLYELDLVPLYLLILIWGGEKSGYAATKFLLYTALSGALILVGCFGMFWLGGASDFSYSSLAEVSLPLRWQVVLLIPLLLGFGIKVPLIPLHTWLPDTYVAASTPVAIMLGGVLAKLGTYGLLRFGFSLMPDGWRVLAPGLAVWAAMTVMYGAIVAIAQRDIKRMVAYSSIGHMGYILLGMAAGNPLSLAGCIAQMVSHGLILAILFHLVGIVEAKVGTRELDVLNGLMNPIRGLPLTSALLVLGGMASAGIPGLVNFAAEFVIFQGSFPQFPVQTLICVVGTGLTAVYFVILLNRTCFGRLDNARAYFPKVTLDEKIPAFVLMALIVFLGIQPVWLMRWTESTPVSRIAEVTASAQVSLDVRQSPLALLSSFRKDGFAD